MFIGILVARVEDPRAADSRLVQRRLDLEGRARRAIVPQPPVKLAAPLRIHRCSVLRACIIAVLGRVETEEFRHPLVYRPAERADINPAVAAFECVVRLEPRGTVSGMPINGTLAGEERQGVAIGLRHRLVLREVDHLAAPALLHLP